MPSGKVADVQPRPAEPIDLGHLTLRQEPIRDSTLIVIVSCPQLSLCKPTDIEDCRMPFKEPLQATALRTGTLALVFGTVIFVASAHRIRWPVAVLVALWPALGGHWVELSFLNMVKPRLAPQRYLHTLARLVVWSVGGLAIALMMRATARTWSDTDIAWRMVWFGGPAFIAIELVVHAALAARGMPNFFDGRQ